MASQDTHFRVPIELFELEENFKDEKFLMTRGQTLPFHGQYLAFDLKRGTTDEEANTLAEMMTRYIASFSVF